MSFKSKIKEIIYDKIPFGPRSFPYFGVNVYFPKGSHLFYVVCQTGVYEQNAIRILSQLVLNNTYFFDIGANIGLISIPILKNKSSCHCVSFEPSPNSLPYLERTAKESDLSNRWIIIGKAAGAFQGEQDFHLSSPDLGAFEGIKSTGRVPVMGSVKIPITTIDIEWNKLGCPTVSVIKIDVEGAEADVLAGAFKCITTCKPYIYLEWNFANLAVYGMSPSNLLNIAKKLNYAIYVMPNMARINSENELSTQMLFFENFLLCPM